MLIEFLHSDLFRVLLLAGLGGPPVVGLIYMICTDKSNPLY